MRLGRGTISYYGMVGLLKIYFEIPNKALFLSLKNIFTDIQEPARKSMSQNLLAVCF
jgi:hypothetical protein